MVVQLQKGGRLVAQVVCGAAVVAMTMIENAAAVVMMVVPILAVSAREEISK